MTYPFFIVECFHQIHHGLACKYQGAAPLNHGNIIAMLVIVLSNVVRRIARTNYDGLFIFADTFQTRKFSGMYQAITLKILEAIYVCWKAWVPARTGGLDDMSGMNST